MRECLTLALLLWFLANGTAFAVQDEPLPVEKALRTHSFDEISPFEISPDGRWLAMSIRDNQRIQHFEPGYREEVYARTGVNVHDSAGDIWLCDTETGETTNITEGAGSSWEPSWSPDGHYLAFLSDRAPEGQANLWVWDIKRKELRRASGVAVRAQYELNRIEWLPDSRRVLITAVPLSLSIDEYFRKLFGPDTRKRANINQTTPSLTVSVFESDPATNTDHPAPTFNLDTCCLHDLLMIDVVSGVVTPIIAGSRIENYVLSPDGLRIAYAVPKSFEQPGSWRRRFDLMILDLATKRTTVLASNALLNDVLSWSPDARQITFAILGEDGESYELFAAKIDSTQKKLAELHTGHRLPQAASLRPIWDAKGERFYFLLNGDLWTASTLTVGLSPLAHISGHHITHILSQRKGQLWATDQGKGAIVIAHDDDLKQDGFYGVDLITGRTRPLLERGECYTCKWLNAEDSEYLTAVSPDGQKLIYVAENSARGPDLWIGDSQLNTKRQLTHLNPQFESYRMGTARLIDWISGDGRKLRGALLLPAEYKPGLKYPLLVWVYPDGSESNSVDEFALAGFPGPFNLQLFATRGYAVLLPDSPDDIGDRMGSLAKSVLPGVDKVVEMGIADPNRVGVMGHSQGGYAVLALITETKRFRIAVSADGWGDFTEYYGLMEAGGASYQFGQAERQLGGAPWQFPLRYIQNSPIYYLDRVETPLLLVHGSNDDSHPIFLANEVFVGLRRLGKKVEYARYDGETHAPQNWNYANQVDLADRVISWADKGLKSDTK